MGLIMVVVKEEETQKNIERDLKERTSQPVLIFVCLPHTRIL